MGFNKIIQYKMPFCKWLSKVNLSFFIDTFITYLSIHLEKAMATHSSTLVWKIPWMEEPGRLQSMESLRVKHN